MRMHRWKENSAPRMSVIGRLCSGCGLREFEAPDFCALETPTEAERIGSPSQEQTASEQNKNLPPEDVE